MGKARFHRVEPLIRVLTNQADLDQLGAEQEKKNSRERKKGRSSFQPGKQAFLDTNAI